MTESNTQARPAGSARPPLSRFSVLMFTLAAATTLSAALCIAENTDAQHSALDAQPQVGQRLAATRG